MRPPQMQCRRAPMPNRPIPCRRGFGCIERNGYLDELSPRHRLTRGLPPESPVPERHSGNTESLVSSCYRHPLTVKCPRPISISLSRLHANLSSTTRPRRLGKPRPQAFPTSRKSNHSHSRPEFPVGLAGTLEGPPADRQATTPRPPRWRGRNMSSDVDTPYATSQADRFEMPSDICHPGRRR